MRLDSQWPEQSSCAFEGQSQGESVHFILVSGLLQLQYIQLSQWDPKVVFVSDHVLAISPEYGK